MPQGFSHIDLKNQPTMVDVSHKNETQRSASARSFISLPLVVWEQFNGGEIQSKKGPVIQTAIIAGTMAVKQTANLIPFCHPLIIESCKFDITATENHQLMIECTVKITGKTGVEMEALTGASIAALTIYDMCKAFGHEMQISGTELIVKSGGKSDLQKGELKC
ncbi:MAG: cyclic pyranopterin monophosphate synthase MoaC [Halobacteriovoraceae bacterium]|jgi:cyclic pyranopterin monophosphate synthase|nr:cyclic pyranopterin monophosphate synthase MoaC [Halobacteriovoraceae bacterium]MBT5096056.1 cyclic pyranopterin monophosphate synthase MoaC [Halobacteriovoraceae bacterium]